MLGASAVCQVHNLSSCSLIFVHSIFPSIVVVLSYQNNDTQLSKTAKNVFTEFCHNSQKWPMCLTGCLRENCEFCTVNNDIVELSGVTKKISNRRIVIFDIERVNSMQPLFFSMVQV